MITYSLNMWELSSSLEKFRPGGGQWKKEPRQEFRDSACVLSHVRSQLCSSTCSPFSLSKVSDLDQASLPTVPEKILRVSSPPRQCNHSDISAKPWENLLKSFPPLSSAPPIEVYLHMDFTAQRRPAIFHGDGVTESGEFLSPGACLFQPLLHM